MITLLILKVVSWLGKKISIPKWRSIKPKIGRGLFGKPHKLLCFDYAQHDNILTSSVMLRGTEASLNIAFRSLQSRDDRKTLFRQPLRFTRRSFLFQYSPPKTPDTLCQKAFHTAFLKVSNATSIKQPNSHVSHRAFSIRSKP